MAGRSFAFRSAHFAIFHAPERKNMYQIFIPKKRSKTELWQMRAQREGRGTGSGDSYKPFIRVRRSDFPSRGRSQIVFNPTNDTQHHCLSRLEANFVLVALSLGVKDIREQYAMRLEDGDPEFQSTNQFAPGTLTLCQRMGIRHPIIRRHVPRVQDVS
jgi:hypothetical protein